MRSLLAVCLFGVAFGQFRSGGFRSQSQPSQPTQNQQSSQFEDPHPATHLDTVEELCQGRPPNEYFRLDTEGDCRNVVRCDRAGIAGTIRLASVKCPSGLAFDLERQTCDWRNKVPNCDRLSKPRLIRPNFNTVEPVCPDGQLQCGDGECVATTKFCDGSPDCTDGSDENACSVDEDPNRAPACGADCQLPDCYCSADGTVAPGGGKLELNNIPMMITMTFNGAVNGESLAVYERLFNKERLNPNGCTAKATFFVSHKYTNYSAVQELHRVGHEIGVFSITNNEDSKYWTEGSYDNWLGEMAGARLIVEKFANITHAMATHRTAHHDLTRSGRCQLMSSIDEMILSMTRLSPDVTLSLPALTSMLRNLSDSFCSTTSNGTTARTGRRCRCLSTRPG